MQMAKDPIDEKGEDKRDLIDVALEELDRTCFSILSVLLEDKTLRFKELQNAIIKISNLRLTNKILSKHLKHLVDKGLVKRTEEGFQEVTYSLSDRFKALTQLSPEEIKKYLELEFDENLPPQLRAYRINEKDRMNKLSLEDFDKETDRDLHDILSLNLWEFKLSVEDDLELKKGESDDSFYKFLGKPMYRIRVERVSEKCRYSDEYKKMLFDKIDLLIDNIRSDRQLPRKRRETGKRVPS
jgi:DNA-binding HxlR family transcriptional regulator